MGIGDWGSEWGLGIGDWGSEWGLGFGVWNRDWSLERGLEFGTGIGVGNMRQNKYQNMKHVEERDQEQGYERINRNDKAGDNGLNRAGPGD